jgi:hypothetical protein
VRAGPSKTHSGLLFVRIQHVDYMESGVNGILG